MFLSDVGGGMLVRLLRLSTGEEGVEGVEGLDSDSDSEDELGDDSDIVVHISDSLKILLMR